MRSLFNGWKIALASLKVLLKSPGVLFLSILSTTTTCVLALLILSPGVGLLILGGDNSAIGTILTIILTIAVALVGTFVTIYFNVAICAIILKKIDGQSVGFGYGFSYSNSRLGQIFGFAAISATIGLILSAISNASHSSRNIFVSILGSIFASLGAATWAISTFLVIPIIVIQNKGVGDALKESVSLIKSTFGEQVGGTTSFGLITFLISLPVISIAFLIIIFSALSGIAVLIVFGIILMVLSIILIAILNSTLSIIFRSILYKYVTTGKTSEGFSEEMLKNSVILK